uniref:Anion exchange protein n=1 Tax=Steinernema glaseri TaxID=37863 RepID=A0A1I7YLL3_9BILA
MFARWIDACPILVLYFCSATQQRNPKPSKMVSDSPGVPLLSAEEDGQHLTPRSTDTSQKHPEHERHVCFAIGEGTTTSPPSSPKPDMTDLNILQELLSVQHERIPNDGPNKTFSYTSMNSVNSVDSVFGADHRKQSALTPTRVLIELYDLNMRDEERNEGVWKESARWIKYEEDVEGVDHHWGLPHVAFLSFHSLLQLRKCMAKGVILLDLDATSYEEICESIAKAMSYEGHNMANTKKIMEILQMKHCQVPNRRMSRISTAASGFFERHTATLRTSSSAVPIAPRRDSTVYAEPNRGFYRQHSFQQPTILEDDEYQNSIQKGGSIPVNQRSYPNVCTVENVEAGHSMPPHRKRQSVVQFISNTLADLNKKTTSKSGELTQYRGEEIMKKAEEETELAQVLVGPLSFLTKARFVMVRLSKPTYLPEIVESKVPIRFLFVILGPHLEDGNYHELGRSIATLMANQEFNRIAYGAGDKSQLIEGIDQFLDDSVVIPPGEVDSKRLLSGDEIKKALKKRKKAKAMAKVHAQNVEYAQNSSPRGSQTSSENRKRRRFFNGMVDDLNNRSDIKDALDFQCITSIVFMFFASFAPAITFGGLMGQYTNDKIGTTETLVAQCVCGIIWGLFAAQPLLIMSATGPVLIFEASLYTFCEMLGVDFLTVRWYSGLWIFIISIITVAVDGSKLLKYVTRFTEDIFAALISAIFIAESFSFLSKTWKDNPIEDYAYYKDFHVDCSNRSNGTEIQETMASLPCNAGEPNTALLTGIIMIATFLVAYGLRQLRDSFYLGRHLRRAIGDFGVLIAIALVSFIAYYISPDPYLARLDMPDSMTYTNLAVRGHGLIVDPTLPGDKWWAAVVALIPALLVFILLFVETEITELLLARKERGLKKGSGMHWDLILMGGCAFLCSVLGLPWMCAAAVQSLAHCSSLTKMKKAAPGERPKVDKVVEQRVTTIGVSALMGAFACAGSYLRLPLASLFGVFLYLGVMNLSGVQMINRVILFFIPEKYFPMVPYTESVRIHKMHIYTVIQLACLALVYWVKNMPNIALAFPFILMLFIVFRQIVLPRFFSEKELRALDGEEEDDNGEWIDKDFYENAPIPV